jgi:hypothetical protein
VIESTAQHAEFHQTAACGTIVRYLALSLLEYLLYGVLCALQAGWAEVSLDASVVSWPTIHFQDFSVIFLA